MAITLRFTDQWVNRSSPIELPFYRPDEWVILRFNEQWVNRTSPIRLRFGDDTPSIKLGVGVTIPVTVVVDFDVNIIPVDRTFGIELGFSWADLNPVQQALLLAEASIEHEYQFTGAWDNDNGTQINTETQWLNPESTGIHTQFAWAVGDEVRSDLAINWITPDDYQTGVAVVRLTPKDHMALTFLPWVNFTAVDREVAVTWIDGPQAEIAQLISYREIVVNTEQTITWGPHAPRWVCSSKYRPPVGKITLRFSEPLADDQNPIVLRFTASPNYCYWDDGGGLIDGNPVLPPLDFKIPIEPQIRRYYLMQPTLSCLRITDGQVIVITSVSISDARGQFTQGISIEFGSAIDASRAHNQLLLITINGYDFFAVAEQVNKSSSFGTASISANGRSKTALLAAPWKTAVSYTNSVAKSFGGLLNDILINSGWTVELVDIPDFMVPAGAYSAIADSPLDLLNDAVSQLNCMMIADEVNQVIKVYPRWPTVPWAFASAVADVNIHDAVIMTYSAQEEINQACDVVWLRGEQKGISASVKRQGYAGTAPAADISASLIVDVQAARVAGTMALADTGNKEMINITLPIMNDLPPLRKGMLIGVTYQGEVYKAICDQVSISATVDFNSGIDIYQSVKLIRHI